MNSPHASQSELLAAFERELAACARERWSDPVAFGWRARRCTEALLHVLIARHAPGLAGSARGANLDKLLAMELFKKGAKGFSPSRDFSLAVQGIQSHGNTFSHFQSEPLDERANAEHVALDLVKLVPPLYERPLDRLPDGVARSVRAIQSARDAIAPPEEQRLRDELEALRQRRVAELRRNALQPKRFVAYCALSFALGAAASALTLTHRRGVEARSSSPITGVPTRRVEVVEDVPPALPTPLAPVPPRLAECPDDSEAIPEMRFQLSAPSDRSWHRPRGVVDQAVVTLPFCLRRSVFTLRELRGLDPAQIDAARGCRVAPRDDAPAGCMTHAEATRLCAAWMPGGRLVSSREWEAAARAVAEGRARAVGGWERTATSSLHLEWVEEPFPAGWLAGGPTRADIFVTRGPIIPASARPSGNHPWNSWNQHRDERVQTIYVRCALTR